MSTFQAVAYEPGALILLDQTKLPLEEVYERLSTVEAVARAIETMVVRGAPAIGIAAAYGMAIAARTGVPLPEADSRLRRTRPTAVNLFWALDRMQRVWAAGADTALIEAEAQAIAVEDAAACARIGELGAALVPDGAGVLTHCNAGALATATLGTALAVIRAAHKSGKRLRVFADETRPWLQGARLTTWELMKDGLDVTLICDGAAAHLAGAGEIDLAVVGADRIAKNGDAANKIGTRGVACVMRAHDRPLYVAVPWSTVDLSLADGRSIRIEERPEEEVTVVNGRRIAPPGVKVRNPSFDVTPAAWIAGIVTDRGVTGPDHGAGLAALDK